MMRILRSLESQRVQEQICALRIGSKEEVLTQLQISLEMYCQVKEQLECTQEQLLNAKVKAENLQREIHALSKSMKNLTKNKPEDQGNHVPPQPPQQPTQLLDIDDDLYNQTILTETDAPIAKSDTLNVPRKFLFHSSSSRRSVPDGSGGSKGILQVNSGKRFLI